MIDYHSDQVALAEFIATLATATPSDPVVTAARDAAIDAVSAHPEAALLGAFVHQLLAHAASDGAELDLLDRASRTWAAGLELYDEVTRIRSVIERTLEDPTADGAADDFNAAAVDAQILANRANALRPGIDALRADTMALRHLARHPRQSDRPVDEWDWANLTLARRTDAVTRALYRHASDQATTALAVGAVSAYGANAAGSAYLWQVVGGPRRSHRHRDRIARYAVGEWLARFHPAGVPLSQLADRLTAGGAVSELDPALAAQLEGSLAEAFDHGGVQSLPSLSIGFERLVRHLRLLPTIRLPEPPGLPSGSWTERLYGDPQSSPPSLRTRDADVNGMDGGGVAVTYTTDPQPGSKKSSSTDAATVCGIIFLILILIDVVQALVRCIVQWAQGDTCTFWQNMFTSALFEQDPPDPTDPTGPQTPDVTAQGLSTIGAGRQGEELVHSLYEVQAQMCETLHRAHGFLAYGGLIYPGPRAEGPLFAQFTRTGSFVALPRRAPDDPFATSYAFPQTPVESPAEEPSFDEGSAPDAWLGTWSTWASGSISLSIFTQVAAGTFDAGNLDLDADRSGRHLCWQAAGSVHDDPIAVQTLGYADY